MPLIPSGGNTALGVTSADPGYEEIDDVPLQPSMDPQPLCSEAKYQNSGQQPGSRDTYVEPVSSGEAHTYLIVTVCMFIHYNTIVIYLYGLNVLMRYEIEHSMKSCFYNKASIV